MSGIEFIQEEAFAGSDSIDDIINSILNEPEITEERQTLGNVFYRLVRPLQHRL